MTWIKICGTTNLEDAQMCVEAGADALGFIFAESPRKIQTAEAAEIVAGISDKVEKVGVFADEKVEALLEIAQATGLTAVQLHGNELGDYVHEVVTRRGLRVIQTVAKELPEITLPKVGFPFGFGADLGHRDQIYALLFDSGRGGLRGGTGRTWDWKRGVPALEMMQKNGHRCIVAGGLNPENVSEAIRILRPWGVDVVTGVEREPGKKDPKKVKAFTEAVRRAEQGLDSR